MKVTLFLIATLAATSFLAPNKSALAQTATPKKPNIIFFLADDLGYGELGCYGQQRIKTPNLDQLAKDGVRFTQFYSGHPVCAPSRCVFLTGKHTGHATIRDNSDGVDIAERDRIKAEDGYLSQQPIKATDVTIAQALQGAGYKTACIGKWGLGHPSDTGDPLKHGFDLFYGEYSQWQAHNYYPTYLWRNHTKETLEGNDGRSVTGKQYAPDLMEKEALQFIRDNKDRLYFLYFATPVPHVSLQVPEDEPSLAAYRQKFRPDPPFGDGGDYTAAKTPRATYAAMITRMDRTLGKMRALLKETGQEKNTLIVFASDNGATFNGGYDRAFFNGSGPLRGMKTEVWEGGIRVPTIAAWPGRIAPNQTSDFVGASWDFFPTFAALAGAKTPTDLDGVSIVPTLLGDAKNQRQHEYLYWEMATKGQQAVRLGDWKGVRLGVRGQPNAPVQLFNLAKDIGETTNVAAQNPEIVARIRRIMETGRTPNKEFPMGGLDQVTAEKAAPRD